MEINKLIKLQMEFDALHNWIPLKGNTKSTLSAINKDVIGILGELGEFANIIKKLNLAEERVTGTELDKKYREYKDRLSGEIVDTFIYLIRLISHLEIDIAEEFLKKIEINRVKYKMYERNG